MCIIALAGCTQDMQDVAKDASKPTSGQANKSSTETSSTAGNPLNSPGAKDPSIRVVGAAFSPEGDRLLVSFKTHFAKVSGFISKLAMYTAGTGQLQSTGQAKEWLTPLAIYPGGKLAVVAGYRSLQLWDIQSGEFVKNLVEEIEPLSFSQVYLDKDLAVTVSQNIGLRVWDLKTGKMLFSLPGGVHCGGVLSPDGRLLACTFSGSTKKNSVEVWDIKDKNLLFSTPQSKRWGINSFTPDGKYLLGGETILSAIGSGPNMDFISQHYRGLWDPKNGKLVKKLEIGNGPILGFIEDGRTVLIEDSPAVKAFDLEKATLLWEIKPAGQTIVLSPDGKYMFTAAGAFSTHPASSGYPMQLKLWDLTTRTVIQRFEPVL
jgi:WD40 repeat protein